MTTKQFEFPTFAQWATESYRRMVDKDLFGPTSMGRIEENIAEEFFKEWRRFYALDFLTSLAKFLNKNQDTWDEFYTPVRYNLKWDYDYVRFFDGEYEAEAISAPLFRIKKSSAMVEFLRYEGCGTTAKEQLNILYNY